MNKTKKWYFIFFLLCLLVNLFSLVIFYHTPYFDTLSQDYFIHAKNIVDGNGYIDTYIYQGQTYTIPGIFRPPAYSYLIAGFQFIFGDSLVLFTIFQIFLLSLFIVFFYYAINDIFPKIAKLATFLLIFFLPLIRLSIFKEPGMIVGPLIFISIYYLYKRKYLVSGLLLGLSILFREDAILVLPLILIYIVLERLVTKNIKQTRAVIFGLVLFIIGFLLVLSPWLIRNYEVYDKFPYISIPKAGLSLVAGIGEYDTQNRFGFPFYDQDQIKSEGYDSWFPNPDERDKIRVEKAKNVILKNPIWYVGVMIKRIPQLTYFINAGGDNPLILIIKSFLYGTASFKQLFNQIIHNLSVLWFTILAFIQISIYYLFFFFGLFYLGKIKEWKLVFLFCLVPFAYLLNISHHVEPRYFMPALYFIVPISAYGIYNFINYLKSKYNRKNKRG
jgi:4-amino-4-deoxy-L-arabinose transferase-like glycosyltransferase